jgi:hypothetical protein
MVASPNNSFIGLPAITRSDPDGIGSELAPCHGRATQALVGISLGEVEDKPEPKPVDEKTQPPYCLRPSRAERGSPVAASLVRERRVIVLLGGGRRKRTSRLDRRQLGRGRACYRDRTHIHVQSPIFAQKVLCTRDYRYDPALRPLTFSLS